MTSFLAAVTRALGTGFLVAFAGFAVGQQPYPAKPIRFIVPYPPGGGTNIVARLVGQKLTESWGQPVIVDNRPGANTVIGTEALFRSAPDGYTIMVITSTHIINSLLIPNLPYDAIKDFAPVASLTSSETLLVLHPSVPANNLQEFIALARSRPGQINYATTGSGTVTHLEGELFNIVAGVKMQHIPYKGTGPVIADLIGGQVQATFNAPIAVLAHIKSGKLKAMAITGVTRLPSLPKVPTYSEAGLHGFDVKFWFAVLAPAGTPKPLVDKLSTEIARILAMRDIQEKLASQGTDPFISTPEQLAALMKTETAKFAKVIKAAHITVPN